MPTLMLGRARSCLLISLFPALALAADRPLAFTGAEGYGRFASGGRGGDVYHVTTLDDSGNGSLRVGIQTKQPRIPRTIVFDVGGSIRLKKELRIENIDGLTIAGQTAPGDGVTICDRVVKFSRCSNLIVRFLRFRLGDERKTSDDVLSVGDDKGICREIIFDHLSATWGIDGIMDSYQVENMTLQWCLFGEALNDSTHYKNEPHAMLMSFRNTLGHVSLHHNLFFSSRDRHPTLGGGDPAIANAQAIFDVRNNVIYNWEGSCNLASGRFNLIGNYWRPGPNTRPYRKAFPIAPKAEAQKVTTGFFSGNTFEDQPEWSTDNYQAFQWGVRGGKYVGNVTPETFRQADEIVPASERPVTHSAAQAYALVLEHAGASRVRDAADQRIIAGIQSRTNRRIDSQKEVGGWPELLRGEPPVDTDRDGLPDAWERQDGLDPRDPSDRNRLGPGGQTALERFLDSLARSRAQPCGCPE